ncbi:shikimate kinase [Enterococcus ureilyticus]|uniref:Shikimate kinase n=1 Tax=Enterococcus ureilyticus TaxID=1131292 RepID=A0A1E5H8P6_9ENTE|nr:shikimate kinase [Enterococcus ureilyticus]MBM7688663.1 shikimate kinase [Enterococcus ureilyticus]MBO0447105.1 shikimate kinase [Enterococcus ureilyticus]OEG21205.1 shikimate kinase [Enterococcus ureilyticus]
MKGIILIGFMGAGKTTVGKLLSKETGMEHIDFDDKIVEEIGMTIQEYFDLHGEEAFREKETNVLKRYLDHDQVVSTGGGIVMREENRTLLKQMAPVVYLQTKPEVFIPRLKQDHTTIRPLVVSKSPEEIREVFEPRIPFYEESASLVIATDDRTPEEIVSEILENIK